VNIAQDAVTPTEAPAHLGSSRPERLASPLLLCARLELRLAVRSRATQIFAVVFAALALAVAASGFILSGGSGVQDFARTAASLTQLILMLVPLVALVTGVAALSPERGASELLFSQPVSRPAVLLGKLLGLFAALAAAQMAGLGAAGLLIFWRSGSVGVRAYGFLFLCSLTVTAIFLGIAGLVSSPGSGRRTRALALALIVWFVAVVLFDVAALGAASLLPSGTASRVLMAAVVVNPIGALRTGALLAIDGTTAFGPGSLAFLRFTKGPAGAAATLGISILAWIVVPLLWGVGRVRRADI
jgi:Cu-processing system permease protein